MSDSLTICKSYSISTRISVVFNAMAAMQLQLVRSAVVASAASCQLEGTNEKQKVPLTTQ